MFYSLAWRVISRLKRSLVMFWFHERQTCVSVTFVFLGSCGILTIIYRRLWFAHSLIYHLISNSCDSKSTRFLPTYFVSFPSCLFRRDDASFECFTVDHNGPCCVHLPFSTMKRFIELAANRYMIGNWICKCKAYIRVYVIGTCNEDIHMYRYTAVMTFKGYRTARNMLIEYSGKI